MTFTPGQFVSLLYRPLGFDDLTIHLPSEVVAVMGERVRIKIWHALTGEEYIRVVTPEKLQPFMAQMESQL